jgi:quinol monooxygenase YgiN
MAVEQLYKGGKPMAIRLIVSMTAAAGKREALSAAFCDLCPSVQQEPGCQQYEFYQSLEGPDRFVLLEQWDDEESLRVHSERMRARNLNLDALRSHRTVERYTT